MKIIDLSQEIFSGMKTYPGDPAVKINQVHHLKKVGWRLRKLHFGSHTGTHVDAFSHIKESGETLDQISLKRFIGEARVVKKEEGFPSGVGLVFSSEKLDLSLFKKIIKAEAPFVAVSTDCQFSMELEKKLLQNGVLTFTDLVNIDKLPVNKKFMFFGFPLKIKDGDGSPIRAVAIVDLF
jgi:kynurenine formamidase